MYIVVPTFAAVPIPFVVAVVRHWCCTLSAMVLVSWILPAMADLD
jgi:hypothetical protein